MFTVFSCHHRAGLFMNLYQNICQSAVHFSAFYECIPFYIGHLTFTWWCTGNQVLWTRGTEMIVSLLSFPLNLSFLFSELPLLFPFLLEASNIWLLINVKLYLIDESRSKGIHLKWWSMLGWRIWLTLLREVLDFEAGNCYLDVKVLTRPALASILY